jgi:hypothetical protein
VSSLLLLTDGQASDSWKTFEQISRACVDPDFYHSSGGKPLSAPQPLEKNLPCSISTFGYGSDHDAKLLTNLAEFANGSYYFIETNEQIAESFADCLGGLLSVVAQNIVLSFQVSTGVSVMKIPTKFKKNEVKKNEHYEITIGDIQSEESRDIIFFLELPAIPSDMPEFPIGQVSLRYISAISAEKEMEEETVYIQRSLEISPENSLPNIEVAKNKNRLVAAEAMETAAEVGAAGDLVTARNLIETAMDSINSSAAVADPFCAGLVEDLKLCQDNMSDKQKWNEKGVFIAKNNCNSHWVQRSNNVNMKAQQSYQTSARNEMQSKVKSSSRNNNNNNMGPPKISSPRVLLSNTKFKSSVANTNNNNNAIVSNDNGSNNNVSNVAPQVPFAGFVPEPKPEKKSFFSSLSFSSKASKK